ncbi:MAG TPA: M28 family peptidase [Anaerolineae bacterium]|nr:M28 family peptidase [Anaerolineae bacterium]
MEFNPGTALEYARAVTRPRRVGSGEDEAVAGEIEARLREFGYRVERQAFGFSTGVNALISLMLVAGMLLVAAAVWLQWLGTRMAIIPALAVLAPAFLFDRVLRAAGSGCVAPEPAESASLWTALCLRLGSRYRSANLIATRDDRPDPLDRPQLYLVAHYDSKSQRIPLVVRIALSAFAIGGGIAFAVLNVLALPFPGLGPAIIVLGIGVLLATFPLVLIDVGNSSPGAVDNASGIGAVLHLAECLARRRDLPDRLGTTVLITGAEELAVMGAEAYVRRYATVLRQQADAGGLHVLNFDGVGVDGDLFYDPRGRTHPGRLASLVQEAGAELRLPLRRFSPMGVLLDHLPFARHGFDAVTLLAMGRATLSVHTPADSVDKLHVRGFEQAGRVAWRVIEKLAG